MTPQKLSRGQNLALPAGTSCIDAFIGWGRATTEVDASALLLGADGKVGSDADFVFYNQPRSANGAVRFEGITTTGSGARARISIDLSVLPGDVHAVALVGIVAEGTFGSLGALTFTIADGSGTPVAEYTPADATTDRPHRAHYLFMRAGIPVQTVSWFYPIGRWIFLRPERLSSFLIPHPHRFTCQVSTRISDRRLIERRSPDRTP
ncbi:TerD family protein [Nocardia thailandica]